MKKYTQYRVEDFILEDFFKDWVLHKSTSNDAFWKEWIKKHPDKRPVIEEAREILLALQPDQSHISQKEMEKGLEEVSVFYRKMMDYRKACFRKRLLRFSCFLLIVILIGMGLLVSFHKEDYVKRHITQEGQNMKVRLPDGSSVVMQEETRLTYLSDWKKVRNRKVNLHGKAFFHVKDQLYKNSHIKFIVTTSDLLIEVLGTEFLVTQQDFKTRIWLKSGEIKLRILQNEQLIKMVPGEMVEYDASTDNLRVIQYDPIFPCNRQGTP